MTTYQRCPEAIKEMALSILKQYETHKPVLDAGVTIDFVFAHPEIDERTGEPKAPALKLNGQACLGICRKIALKERALGRSDAEISLDFHWWSQATVPEQRALLDHELHHIAIKLDKNGFVRDDLGRPILQLRRHDFQVGWFKEVAARNGENSVERWQAREVMCDMGQYFWPEIAPKAMTEGIGALAKTLVKGCVSSMTISSGGNEVTITSEDAKRMAKTCDEILKKSDCDEDEELVQQCIEVIRSEQKASVSLLQRRLRLSYGRAARIIDEIEMRGLIGPSQGAEPREILFEISK